MTKVVLTDEEENARKTFINLLRRSGMSQADAARAMHFSTATISRYCSGETPVPESSIDHLWRITGLPAGGEREPATMRDGPRWLDEWETELLGIAGRINPKRRADFVASIRSLVNSILGETRYSVARRQDPVGTLADEITASAIESITAGRVTVLGAGASVPIAEPPPGTTSPPPPPRRRAPESRPVSRTASKPDPKHSRLAS